MIAEYATTSGQFQTEPEAWAHFDALVIANGAFKMHREVVGEYVQPRPITDEKTARLDRLLIPLKPALDAGWKHGAIAVEGKKSGNDIGKLIVQALDYSRCVWRLAEGVEGLLLMTEWVFIHPVDATGGTIESIMAQSRVGRCMTERRRIVFASGGMNGLVLHDDGRVVAKFLPMGRKRGSR